MRTWVKNDALPLHTHNIKISLQCVLVYFRTHFSLIFFSLHSFSVCLRYAMLELCECKCWMWMRIVALRARCFHSCWRTRSTRLFIHVHIFQASTLHIAHCAAWRVMCLFFGRALALCLHLNRHSLRTWEKHSWKRKGEEKRSRRIKTQRMRGINTCETYSVSGGQ